MDSTPYNVYKIAHSQGSCNEIGVFGVSSAELAVNKLPQLLHAITAALDRSSGEPVGLFADDLGLRSRLQQVLYKQLAIFSSCISVQFSALHHLSVVWIDIQKWPQSLFFCLISPSFHFRVLLSRKVGSSAEASNETKIVGVGSMINCAAEPVHNCRDCLLYSYELSRYKQFHCWRLRIQIINDAKVWV